MVDLPARFRRQLLETLARRPEVERAILFGSRARGDAEERSDIDLAIEAPAATPHQWSDLRFFLTEESATLLEVDVVRLEKADPAFRQRILAEGEVLYERSQDRAQPGESEGGARSAKGGPGGA